MISPVSIGGVTISCKIPKDLSKVPEGVVPPTSGLFLEQPEILQHMKWMFQKALLRQDMFLIGYVINVGLVMRQQRPPGPLRRWLALYYCSLARREVEYLSLSRDTSESDIK